MSTKLTPEVVAKAAQQVGIDDEMRQRLLEMLSDMTAGEESESERPPPVKKQFVVLVSDPAGKLESGSLVGWVCQIPEADSPVTVEQRVVEAAHHFNTTKRGRLLPVQTVGEACEAVPAKLFKEQQVWVKTKEPVYLITTRNELKDTPSVLGDDRGEYRKEAA